MKTIERNDVDELHLLSIGYLDRNGEEKGIGKNLLKILKESDDDGNFQISLNDENLSGRIIDLFYRGYVSPSIVSVFVQADSVTIDFEEYKNLGKPQVLIKHERYSPSKKESSYWI